MSIKEGKILPRPRKWRRVCCLPSNDSFAPVGKGADNEKIVMTVDEYETIRLIDYQGYTQEQCSQFMGIARTTVQQMYNTARKKLSEVLVDGKCLVIAGGDYKLCEGIHSGCGCNECRRCRNNRNGIDDENNNT